MAKGFFSWFNRGSKDKAAPQETQPEESLKVTPEAEQPAQPDIESVPVTEPQAEMREQVVPFPPQTVITSDNINVSIDTVIYYQVTNPEAATYEIANPMSAIEQLAVTTMRNIIGTMDMEQALTGRVGSS